MFGAAERWCERAPPPSPRSLVIHLPPPPQPPVQRLLSPLHLPLVIESWSRCCRVADALQDGAALRDPQEHASQEGAAESTPAACETAVPSDYSGQPDMASLYPLMHGQAEPGSPENVFAGASEAGPGGAFDSAQPPHGGMVASFRAGPTQDDAQLLPEFASMGMAEGASGPGPWPDATRRSGEGPHAHGSGRPEYVAPGAATHEASERGRARGGIRGNPVLDESRKRDEERERERARNGVRGLRSCGSGGLGGAPGGSIYLSAEVLRIKDSLDSVSFDPNPKYARFFIIKSYSEDDVHKSIKYGVWASTDAGNRRLDAAYRETCTKGPIFLFFSVNASGQFSGMARMESAIDYNKKVGCWAQDKWSGTFAIQWVFIKDIPNNLFRHILLANNENKPVTNSRDTQEIMLEPGREMLHIFQQFRNKTSILDDFGFYDKRQELLEQRTQMSHGPMPAPMHGMQLGTGMPGLGIMPHMLAVPQPPTAKLG